MDLAKKRVCVTGGTGFLGSHIVDKLYEHGCTDVVVPRHSDYDLRLRDHVHSMYNTLEPDIVIHAAASVGGIGVNIDSPADFFYNNITMGTELIAEAKNRAIEKFVVIGTACSYPRDTKVPFKEEDLWNGYPETTNAAYGLSKKMQIVQAQAYRAQYGISGICLLLTNIYGPRDNFDLRTSHAIAAMIRKFIEGNGKVTLWGTGSATRDNIYVEDAAEAVVLATEVYDKPEPVNIGTGVEISISTQAAIIQRLAEYKGTVEWDKTRGDGQPRRCLDVSRAAYEFGFIAKTHFEEGEKRTIDWNRKNK